MKSPPHLNRRRSLALVGTLLAASTSSPAAKARQQSIARVWRGRTSPRLADAYESYLRTAGLPLLQRTAKGVQLFREDREADTWFVVTSYWSNIDDMTAFTQGDPTKVWHLPRDPEYLMELPKRIEIYKILLDRQVGT